jgi:tetratricopeptide (TPR) repeat protein
VSGRPGWSALNIGRQETTRHLIPLDSGVRALVDFLRKHHFFQLNQKFMQIRTFLPAAVCVLAFAATSFGQSPCTPTDYDCRIKEAKQSIALDEHRGYFDLGLAYFGAKKFQESIDSLSRYLDFFLSFDDMSVGHFARARVYMALNKGPEALSDLNYSLKANPDNVAALLYRGAVKSEMTKDFAGAIPDLSEFIRRAEADDRLLPQAYFERGVANAGLKNHTEAVDDFTSAIKGSPNSWEAYSNRAVSLRALKRTMEAASDEARASALKQKAGAK